MSLDLDYQKLEGTLLGRAYDKIGELEELKTLSETMGGVEHLRDSLTGAASSAMRDLDQLKNLDDIEKIKERALSESLEKLDELGLVGSSEKFFANFPALSVGVTYPNYTPLTPVSFLAKAAAVYPERLAVVHGPVRRSWRETYTRCRRLASALEQS